ncbi:MAG: tRNA epoxyqueuosine(34) reductase QueG [candidate division WOR-3 bacterium]
MFEYRIIKLPDLSIFYEHYLDWINAGFYGEMTYLKVRAVERSQYPEFARSVLVARLFYNDSKITRVDSPYQFVVSRYAMRKDYHIVLKDLIGKVLFSIGEKKKSLRFKIFVDSSPVIEKALGYFAGLGFWGINTLLVDPEHGSFFNLGGAFLSVDLGEEILPQRYDYCIGCNLCLSACPTGAIISPFVIDARKCISYLTIEYKGVISKELATLMGNRGFGCDICQEVCPLNTKAFKVEILTPPIHTISFLDIFELLRLDEDRFVQRFKDTPIMRTGFIRFMRNVLVVAYNTRDEKVIALTRARVKELGAELLSMQQKELEGI